MEAIKTLIESQKPVQNIVTRLLNVSESKDNNDTVKEQRDTEDKDKTDDTE